MRAPLTPIVFASFLLAAACSAPAEQTHTPAAGSSAPVAIVPIAEPSPTATASAEPEPEPSAVASAEPQAPPPLPYKDLTDEPGDSRLDAAAALVKAQENVRARVELTKVVADVDLSGSLDAKMAAHALLARACQSLGDTKCAAAHATTVRELWKDPAASAKALDALGGDDKAKSARTARALSALGEAMFYAAEEKRAAADKEKFPVYAGSGKREDVQKHIQTKVVAWYKARRAAVEEAQKAYAAILALQPSPPPRWVVAAASRTGQMWGKLAAEFRAAPIPADWKGTGPVPGAPDLMKEDLRKFYYEAIDQAAAPLVENARAAMMKCQETSRKLGYSDAFSQQCDAWLAAKAAASP